MINFRYIGYGTSFVSEYSERKNLKKDYLYIFSDNRMKSIFSKKMRWNFFNEQPTLLTFNELKEKIFYADKKIVLKEAKRILAFYTSIPKELKEELGIKSYYDVIDIANSFFEYYKLINLNKIEKIENINSWQEKYILHFEKIKESFDNLLKKYNYIPSDWLEDLKYYNGEFFDNFQKIIFIDIIEYEKIYKEIIENLAKIKDVEICLQMEKESFDEENLKLKTAILPKISPSQIYIYQSKDELEESISLIYLLKEKAKKGEFYSPAPENNSFFNLFPHYFGKSQAMTMNDTKLYIFLNVVLDLLLSMEERLGEVYKLQELEKAFENRAFKEYYSLTEEDIKSIKKISSNFYQYISLDILHSDEVLYLIDEEQGFIKKMEKIFKDFNSILNLSSVDELYDYFKNEIQLEKFIQKEYGDVFEKFFEIFGIMKENENMSIHRSFKSYFDGNLGIALLKLTIQYMKDIAVTSNEKVDSERVIIKNIESALYANESKNLFKDKAKFTKTNFFIDITSDLMPGSVKDNLIFTEKQRKVLNFTTLEEKREIKKYRFYQMIFTNKNAVIFTKKNEEKGVDISPFVDELCIKYSLQINSVPIELNKSIEILKESIPSEIIGNIEFNNQNFSKEDEDFKDGKLSIGAYDYENLIKCPLKFYFQKLAQLIPEKELQIEYLNRQMFGTMVHKILENLVKDIWKEVLNRGIYQVEKEKIADTIKREIKNNRAKILVQLDIYFQEILIPLITDNIENFFKKLSQQYKNIGIKRFQGEKDAGKNTPFLKDRIDVYLRGKADLVIESETGNEIIDYKTGGSQKNQLDYYSIILFGDENKSEKSIFNVLDGKIEKSEKIELTKELLQENIINFLESSFYLRSEKKSVCENNGNVCEYIDICGKKRNL